MRYLILSLCIILALGVTICSAEDIGTSRGVYDVPSNQAIEDFLNETSIVKHNHIISKEKQTEIESGMGVDIKLVDYTKLLDQKVLDSSNIEYRFNNRDKEHSVYMVTKINLSVLWQKDE